MSWIRDVGVISSSGDRFEWTIDNFFSLPLKYDSCISSRTFPLGSDYFCITLWPNGSQYFCNRGWFGLCLNKICNSESRFCVKLGIQRADGGNDHSISGEIFLHGDVRELRLMPCTETQIRRNEIVPNGRLTIFCEMSKIESEVGATNLMEEPSSAEEYKKEIEAGRGGIIEEDASNTKSKEECAEVKETGDDGVEKEVVPKSKSLDKLQRDFKELLFSGEDKDLTIRVQGKEFKVHKDILRVRSLCFPLYSFRKTKDNTTINI